MIVVAAELGPVIDAMVLEMVSDNVSTAVEVGSSIEVARLSTVVPLKLVDGPAVTAAVVGVTMAFLIL